MSLIVPPKVQPCDLSWYCATALEELYAFGTKEVVAKKAWEYRRYCFYLRPDVSTRLSTVISEIHRYAFSKSAAMHFKKSVSLSKKTLSLYS